MFCVRCGLELPEGTVQCARCSGRVDDHAAVTGALSLPPKIPPPPFDIDAVTSAGGAPINVDRRVETGPLTPGEAFGSRYHILHLLGIGGMGAGYQAWGCELSVAVAIKVIRPEATADPAAAADVERRFKRELVLARQVTHKNVVRIHDLGEINGIKYITMSFVDGSDLATTLRHAGQLTPSRALHIARGVVAGLAAAHSAGVVHRDLKPANIMIEAGGEAVIMDFGIARSTGGPVVQPRE